MDEYRELATAVIKQYIDELSGDPFHTRQEKINEFEEWFNTSIWGQMFDLDASALSKAIM